MATSDAPRGGRHEHRVPGPPGVDLLPLEVDLFRAAREGELLEGGPGACDATSVLQWGSERTIRATVLRYLLVDGTWPVDSRGVRLRGARITEPLDLESAVLRCPLRIESCYLDDQRPVVLSHATASVVTLSDCLVAGLTADDLVVTRELSLAGTTFTGPVFLRGAAIAGTLTCRAARLEGRDFEGTALAAQGMKADNVFLDRDDASNRAFTARGAVRLWDAEINGSLIADGAEFAGADRNGYALVADRARVKGVLSLVGAHTATGAIRLWDAEVSGPLDCRRGELRGQDHDGTALFADGLKVGADVGFDDGFSAVGALSLRSARIGGSLRLVSARLGRAPNGTSFDATGMEIGHELLWAPAAQVTGKVLLVDANVGQLSDDWTRVDGCPSAGWPLDGRLRLDGFTYSRIGRHGQVTGEKRLEWLRSQYGSVGEGDAGTFAAQPYEQLAKVYRDAGQDREAREVAIARRRDLRRHGDLTRYRRIMNWLLDVTIRYGYQTGRVVAGLAVLYVVFLLFVVGASRNRAIVPTGTSADARATATHCVSSYPCFNAFGYAIDTVVPLISTRQTDYWRPDGSIGWGQACVAVSYVSTGIGWLLATLAAAGYTGLARKD